MDLWIRSQDKESLIKVSNVQYSYLNDKHFIGTYYDNLKILGQYETKERALEVLDEIQERIVNLQLVNLEEKGKARKDVYTREYLRCVYEMPKE